MRRSAAFWMITAAICTLVFLWTNVFAEEAVVESFRGCLRSGNARDLKAMTFGGILFVRLYNPNNPNRDRDILLHSDIPDSFQVPAGGDIPFDLRYLFGGSARTRSLRYLDQKMAVLGFDESIPSIRQFAERVTEFANQRTPSFTPTVVNIGDRYLVLTESEFNGGMLSGSMAVFEKRGGSGVLRAVIDLR